MLLLTGGAQLGDDWVLSDDDFTPTTDIAWYSSFWAEDPLWTNRPADGVAVDRWRNAGTLRTSGAYLTADGLVLPGVAGNYASVPDSNALDITGDITLVARVALTDWTPGATTTVFGKSVDAADQQSFRLRVSTAGNLLFAWSTDGSGPGTIGSTSTAITGFTDGSVGWVAATLDVDNGAGGYDVTFWTSVNGVTWSPLGSTVTGGSTTSIHAGTAPVEIGTRNLGAADPLAGTVSVARVYSGSGFTTAGPDVGSTLVLDADFRTTPGATSFTAATGQPVTVLSTFSANQATGASQPTYRGSVAALNNRPAVDFDGTDDRLEILTGVSLAQPFSVVWIGVTDTIAAPRYYLGTNSASNFRGAGMVVAPGIAFVTHAGTVLAGATPVSVTPYMRRSYFNGASSADATNGTATAGNAGTLALDQIILGAGRTAPSTYAQFQDGKTAFLGIFPGDITASPRWPDFKAWCRIHYNIVIA